MTPSEIARAARVGQSIQTQLRLAAEMLDGSEDETQSPEMVEELLRSAAALLHVAMPRLTRLRAERSDAIKAQLEAAAPSSRKDTVPMYGKRASARRLELVK